MKCKPCITIRQILKIIYLNIILCYKTIRRDIIADKTINAVVCEMDKPYTPWTPDKTLAHIRKTAQENYKAPNDEVQSVSTGKA